MAWYNPFSWDDEDDSDALRRQTLSNFDTLLAQMPAAYKPSDVSKWEGLQNQMIEGQRAQQMGGMAAQGNAQRQAALSGMARFGGMGGGASSILGANMANQQMQQRQQLGQAATQQKLGIGVEGERMRMQESQRAQQDAMDRWKQQMAAQGARAQMQQWED